jgi:hypothetical protein
MTAVQILQRGTAWTALTLAVASGQALELGAILPPVEGEPLSGGILKLPEAARGRVALLIFGFSQDSAKPSRQYAERFEQEMGAAGVAYSLPVIEGAPRLVRGMIRSGMRKDTPKEFQARMLPLVKEEAVWRARLGISKDKEAGVALVVLDRQGKVRFRANGGFSDALLRQVLEAARKPE